MKTKPIDFTGCNPEIAAALAKGQAVWCWVWDADEYRYKGWVCGFTRDSLYKYRTEKESFAHAEPVKTTNKYLPVREMLKKILDAGYEPDNGCFRKSGDMPLRYSILEMADKMIDGPRYEWLCKEEVEE